MDESFQDPITFEIMVDAVMTPYGHSFSESSIRAWLAKHATCPITKKPLAAKDLIPNFTLRHAIEAARRSGRSGSGSGGSGGGGSRSGSVFARLEARSAELADRDGELERTREACERLMAEMEAIARRKTAESEASIALEEETAALEAEERELKARLAKVEAARSAHAARLSEAEARQQQLGQEENRKYIEHARLKQEQTQLNKRVGELTREVGVLREDVKRLFDSAGVSTDDSAAVKRAHELKSQGNSAYKTKDNERAVQLYTEAIDALKPGVDYAFYLNRAAAYTALGDYERSMEDCNFVLERDEDNSKACRRLATNLIRQSRLGKATEFLDRALLIDPTDEQARDLLAHVQKKNRMRYEAYDGEADGDGGDGGAGEAAGEAVA